MTNLRTNWKVNSTYTSPQAALGKIKCWKCAAAGENGPIESIGKKHPGKAQGWLLGFWHQGHWRFKAGYTTTEKEILASYEGVWGASDMISIEAQLLLAPWLPVLGYSGYSKGESVLHVMPLMLHGISGAHQRYNVLEQEIPVAQEFWKWSLTGQ